MRILVFLTNKTRLIADVDNWMFGTPDGIEVNLLNETTSNDLETITPDFNKTKIRASDIKRIVLNPEGKGY